jgi:Domain of Unknown Function (DUF1080)
MVRRAVDRASHLLVAMITLVCPLVLCAAEPKVPEPTGEEFSNQGEYVGQVFAQMGESPVGVQVATQGNGKFTASGLLGGLPGDGWDRSPRRGAKGELKNGAVEIKSEEYSATIQNGVMSISVAGVKISDLKKQDRKSATFGAPPPAGAVVLFDGSDASKFDNGKIDEDGFLLPGCVSKESFGNGKLHIEFRVPFMPTAEGQGRGNSGVYLAGRYEVQILDSFGDAESDNGCGAIYSVKEPDQNMCYPPFAWQTYDIDFTAPEFKDGKKVEDSQAVMTVRHNGVLVHRKAKLAQPTAGAKLEGEAETGPIYLQDHNCPVRFQNIWFQNAPPKAEEKK